MYSVASGKPPAPGAVLDCRIVNTLLTSSTSTAMASLIRNRQSLISRISAESLSPATVLSASAEAQTRSTSCHVSPRPPAHDQGLDCPGGWSSVLGR